MSHGYVVCLSVIWGFFVAKKKLRVASFFAGIGGFDLGFERAGLETVWQCEISPFCQDILRKHWTEVPHETNIKKVDPSKIPEADVWAGGFPCQDVSVARMSKRSGLRGQKSGLFFDFAEKIAARTPRVVVIENVPGLLSSHSGRDFRIVISTLAELGYGVAWRVLNSQFFGVAQSRKRVYIVGCLGDPRAAGSILFEPERGERNDAAGRSNGAKPISPFKERLGDPRKGPIVQKIAYCLYACSARHTGTDWSRTYISYPDGRVRRLMPVECERIQGFPDGWTIPENCDLDVDKLDSLRYHAIGNAVTVPVAEWLGNRIVSVIQDGQTKQRKGRGRKTGVELLVYS